MSATPTMPPGWFELLLEEQPDEGPGLPDAFRAVYGGDWRLPAGAAPYLFLNFCAGRDGRVSFAEPGHLGGGDVSGFDEHDRWLMGLLRARADVVMMGDGTLRAESDHLWTAEFIFPAEAEAFSALRRAEGRRPLPLQAFVSLSGELPWDAAVFGVPENEVVIATTATGAEAVRDGAPAVPARLEVLELGEDEVDFARLVRTLAERHGAHTILCEGGPRVYGSILRAGLPCDEFLTVSPIVLGDGAGGPPRPSLVEGSRFMPGAAPRSRLLSVRRAGDHLFLRSRYQLLAPEKRGREAQAEPTGQVA